MSGVKVLWKRRVLAISAFSQNLHIRKFGQTTIFWTVRALGVRRYCTEADFETSSVFAHFITALMKILKEIVLSKHNVLKTDVQIFS